MLSFILFCSYLALPALCKHDDSGDDMGDFNPKLLNSGSKYKSHGLQFGAGAVDDNLGLDTDVGKVLTMPAVQYLQADGTVLVQTSPRQSSPCHPDPCKHLPLYTCTAVNHVTARCSGRKYSEAPFFQHSSRPSALVRKSQPHHDKFLSGIRRTISRLNDEFSSLKDSIEENKEEDSLLQVNKFKRSKMNIVGDLAVGKTVPVNSSRQIIIATSWRSGSTFLGDLLNHYPGTFYHFEPFHYYYSHSRDKSKLQTKTNFLKSLLSCKFDEKLGGFLDHMIHSSELNYFKKYNFRLMKSCQDFKPKDELCFSQDYLNIVCPLYPIRLIKTVRMRVRATEELLGSTDNVQVIVLVRDPRAVFSSKRSDDVPYWCKKGCSDLRVSCKLLSNDIEASYELQKKFPGKIKLVRYEDLSLSPEETARQLLEFLNLPWHEAIGHFIDTHTKTNLKKRDPYGTIRNSTAAVSAWKLSLGYPDVSRIQEECREPMAELGYRMISSVVEMKSQEPELEKMANDVWPFKH